MKQKKDVFNKLSELSVFPYFCSIYKRHHEMILYIFFGGLAFLVSIFTFAFFHMLLDINELIANVLSWIITVLFAFFTNRIWVFKAYTKTYRELIVQLFAFLGGRIITLIVEEGILFIFITLLNLNSMMIKISAQVIVIVLNYVISKLVIFKK